MSTTTTHPSNHRQGWPTPDPAERSRAYWERYYRMNAAAHLELARFCRRNRAELAYYTAPRANDERCRIHYAAAIANARHARAWRDRATTFLN